MFEHCPSRPLLVSDDARDCALAVIESGELSDMISVTQEEMEFTNDFLYKTIRHTSLVISSYETERHGRREIAQVMQSAFETGAYTTYMAFSFENADVPCVTSGALRQMYLYHEQKPKLEIENLWLEYLLGDVNLHNVALAAEQLLERSPKEVAQRMNVGAGCISSILNHAVILSN